MTPQNKKELDFVIRTVFKLAVGIIIIFAILFTIANFLK